MRLDDNFGKRDSFDAFNDAPENPATKKGLALIMLAGLVGLLLLFQAERPSSLHSRQTSAATMAAPLP